MKVKEGFFGQGKLEANKGKLEQIKSEQAVQEAKKVTEIYSLSLWNFYMYKLTLSVLIVPIQ